MGSMLKKVLETINGIGKNSLEINHQSPRNKPSLDRDVEQEEEFQYSSRQCLSSYYSVFVVRLAIMVMLAILIGMLTLLTWHFTRVYTRKSLQNLAYGLRYELLQRPVLRMWSILNSTAEITSAQVKLSEYVIRRYSKPVNQAQQVELYEVMRDVTWALFASHKALNAITIHYKNGFVQAFHRDHRSNNTFYIYSHITNYSITNTNSYDTINNHSSRHGWNDQSIRSNSSAIWFREPLDPTTGEKIGKPSPILRDDLINIAGISQVPDGAASWHVAVSKYTDSPLLSAALPVWDASNENIVAVVGVTTALSSVGQLMKDLVDFHSGHIYLTSQQGWLLATSTNGTLLTNTTNGPKLTMPTDSSDTVIRLGAQWLKRNKFPPPSHEVHVENARLGDQFYYIDSFFLNLKRLPMVGVLIIPRKYIMGKVDERAFKTLVILISASFCILVIGCVCIFVLTSGVSKEMKLRAALICQLDARRKAEASSNFKSQFLANMSHELRTPMAAVIGLLDILISDDCLTNEQSATITQIRNCSTALLRLLNNILDLSKVESGKLVLEEAEFDLGRELEGLVDMFSVQCINHNVEIVLDLSDDMPKLVQGDSARVVQIFANLIINSIKFTTTGYIVVRGWCEIPDTSNNTKNNRSFKQQPNKVIFWFEVDDTGCGIDPSKWEAVFESFEQADPSTTRTHGGTGLGLCIVRTLKWGGEIKVVKKNGPGTVMQLYLLLNSHTEISEQQKCQPKYSDRSLMVLLALNGSMGRSIMSQWLQKNNVFTWEASEWNELIQVLQNITQTPHIESEKSGDLNTQEADSVFIIVVDICLLDLNTDIWREQLNFLEKYHFKAKFVWILNHDTSNTLNTELRSKGHLLMLNRPLHKAKMIHILEAAIKEKNLEISKINALRSITLETLEGDPLECLEIDPINYEEDSSDDCDKPNSIISYSQRGFEKENQKIHSVLNCSSPYTLSEENMENGKGIFSLISNTVSEQKALDGLRILLAEDTPVLQRVATMMLEKLGANVVVVGDGIQAVDALNISANTEENVNVKTQSKSDNGSIFDLVLMDCQMPKMDGYEATKAIRKSEIGTKSHIPVVALTAHAMLSDEAKCLEVGMDAYLTKPIDSKLMASTILSLTKRIT